MTTTSLAEWIINLMPWTWAVKTVMFATLVCIMWRQEAQTRLGRWIFRLYIVVTLTSAVMTYQTYYLTLIASGEDIDSPRLWFIVVGTAFLPILVSFCGIKVVLYNFQLDRQANEISAREARQDKRDAGQVRRRARQERRETRQDRREARLDTREGLADIRQIAQDEHDADGSGA